MEVSETENPRGTEIFCSVCSASIPNETTLQAHLKGQKHARNLARQIEWNDSAKRSVYVGGLKQVVAVELALPDYFNRFGSTRKVTIDKTLRQYAIVELDSEEAVNKVLHVTDHVINGVSVIIKPRTIKDSKWNASEKRKEPNKLVAIPDELWTKMAAADDTWSQVLILLSSLQLNENDKHLRDLIRQLILSALSEAFSGCSLTPYGSSVSGFGTSGCDLDLHFSYEKIDSDVLQAIKNNQEETLASDTSVGPHDVVVAIGEVIKQCVPDCHKVKVITQTRFPLVRFYHKGSGVRCDLSLVNQLAVVNTKYLQICCSLYPHFRPLVFVIRTWMKHWGLAGGLHFNGPRLNNYAVTLLVLFYLLNTKKIPSLEEMMASVDSPHRVYVEGWDCTLPYQNTVTTNGSDNSLEDNLAGFFQFYSKVDFASSVLNLRTASYDKPSAPDKPDKAAASSCKPRSFKYGALNIQDPFELSHNVAGNVTEKQVRVFNKCINNAALAAKMKRYRHKTLNNSSWGVLNLFVDHHQKQSAQSDIEKAADFAEHCLRLTLKDGVTFEDASCGRVAGLLLVIFRDVFRMDCGLQKLETSSETKSPITTQASELPVPQTPEISKTSNLKRPASPEEDNLSAKRSKIVLDSPTAAMLRQAEIEPLLLPCEIHCAVTHKLWEGRRKARRKLVQKGLGDLLDLERKVSSLLLSDSKSNHQSAENSLNLNDSFTSISDPSELLFKFLVKLVAAGNSLVLRFSCLSTNGGSDYINFLHHLDVFLPSFVNKCMKSK